jgi:hypothetical protein
VRILWVDPGLLEIGLPCEVAVRGVGPGRGFTRSSYPKLSSNTAADGL